MLRRFSFFLTLVLLTSSAYSASTLKEALATYTYSVEVDWDQKDPGMLNAYQERLEKDMDELMKVQSPEVLMEEALALSGPAISKDLRTLLDQVSFGKIQKDEFQEKMIELYESSRMKGASWNGVTTLALGAVAVVALYYIAVRVYMYEWGKRFY